MTVSRALGGGCSDLVAAARAPVVAQKKPANPNAAISVKLIGTSAPVVASVYHPAMAPVGLLMAVAGYVLGIYAGLLCATLLSLVAGA